MLKDADRWTADIGVSNPEPFVCDSNTVTATRLSCSKRSATLAEAHIYVSPHLITTLN